MDLRQLKYFQRIVAAGSISKAASELHVAQPATVDPVGDVAQDLHAGTVMAQTTAGT